ncbi:MAG: peptidoglycan DD-metalloendopeptidase family protein [Candidatus Binatia bacterium]
MVTRRERENAPLERATAGRSPAAVLTTPLVALALFSAIVRSADSSSRFEIDQAEVLEGLKARIEESTPPTVIGAPELREVREAVRRGDTFGHVLRRVAIIGDSEISRWLAASRKHPSLSRLQPDHVFTLVVPSGTDRLAGLQYEISPDSMLVMREDGDRILAHVERLPRMLDVRVATAAIESNLYASAVRAGVPDSVISSVVDIFGWEIDFTSDLRIGDSFRVAWEQYHDGNGGRVASGRVLAAELVSLKRSLRAVYFEAADDGGSYYDPTGRPFSRAYLRYPVEFTRISSQFTHSRFHPVLGVRRPHLGVDFAAPIGTPVRAIGGGKVRYAGWKGGSGRFVKIDHGAGLESSYSHLKSIGGGIRAGARVQMGQVIGSVGASGLATGPHLHFALYRNGIYVNPMKVALPAAPPLPARYRADFERARDELLAQLAGTPQETVAGAVRVASAEPLRAN